MVQEWGLFVCAQKVSENSQLSNMSFILTPIDTLSLFRVGERFVCIGKKDEEKVVSSTKRTQKCKQKNYLRCGILYRPLIHSFRLFFDKRKISLQGERDVLHKIKQLSDNITRRTRSFFYQRINCPSNFCFFFVFSTFYRFYTKSTNRFIFILRRHQNDCQLSWAFVSWKIYVKMSRVSTKRQQTPEVEPQAITHELIREALLPMTYESQARVSVSHIKKIVIKKKRCQTGKSFSHANLKMSIQNFPFWHETLCNLLTHKYSILAAINGALREWLVIDWFM